MAIKGRKPKPTALKLLNGTRKSRINLAEPKSNIELASPVMLLTKDQQELFDKVLKNAPKGLLTALDAPLITRWCVSKDIYIKASLKYTNEGSKETIKNNGRVEINPLLKIMNQQLVLLQNMEADIGMNPMTRSRLVTKSEKNEVNKWLIN